ncbi:MAG: hypothetical protein ACFHU9_09120 [Fluviicola sp.]
MNNDNLMPLSDLPHESLLHQANISKDSLSAAILNALSEFQNLYNDAMTNGVDEATIAAIRSKSEEIAVMIQSGLQEEQKSGNSGLGFLAVLGVIAGVAFGVREITK